MTRRSILRTFIIWMFVFPLVTGTLLMLERVAPSLPLIAQTFILTALVVPAISLLIAPRALALFPDSR